MGGFAAGGAAVGAGLNIFQTMESNKAGKRTAKSLINASLTKEAQLRASRNVESSKIGYTQLKMLGQLRTIASDSGIGTDSNTALALEQSINASFLMDQEAEDTNLVNNVLFERLGLQSGLSNIQSSMQSPFLSGLSGGLQGLALGLNLDAGLEDLLTRDKAQKKQSESTSRQRDISDIVNPYGTQRR